MLNYVIIILVVLLNSMSIVHGMKKQHIDNVLHINKEAITEMAKSLIIPEGIINKYAEITSYYKENIFNNNTLDNKKLLSYTTSIKELYDCIDDKIKQIFNVETELYSYDILYAQRQSIVNMLLPKEELLGMLKKTRTSCAELDTMQSVLTTIANHIKNPNLAQEQNDFCSKIFEKFSKDLNTEDTKNFHDELNDISKNWDQIDLDLHKKLEIIQNNIYPSLILFFPEIAAKQIKIEEEDLLKTKRNIKMINNKSLDFLIKLEQIMNIYEADKIFNNIIKYRSSMMLLANLNQNVDAYKKWADFFTLLTNTKFKINVQNNFLEQLEKSTRDFDSLTEKSNQIKEEHQNLIEHLKKAAEITKQLSENENAYINLITDLLHVNPTYCSTNLKTSIKRISDLLEIYEKTSKNLPLITQVKKFVNLLEPELKKALGLSRLESDMKDIEDRQNFISEQQQRCNKVKDNILYLAKKSSDLETTYQKINASLYSKLTTCDEHIQKNLPTEFLENLSIINPHEVTNLLQPYDKITRTFIKYLSEIKKTLDENTQATEKFTNEKFNNVHSYFKDITSEQRQTIDNSLQKLNDLHKMHSDFIKNNNIQNTDYKDLDSKLYNTLKIANDYQTHLQKITKKNNNGLIKQISDIGKQIEELEKYKPFFEKLKKAELIVNTYETNNVNKFAEKAESFEKLIIKFTKYNEKAQIALNVQLESTKEKKLLEKQKQEEEEEEQEVNYQKYLSYKRIKNAQKYIIDNECICDQIDELNKQHYDNEINLYEQKFGNKRLSKPSNPSNIPKIPAYYDVLH